MLFEELERIDPTLSILNQPDGNQVLADLDNYF
jgi:hypothetical protein